jgi:uncharacterized protein (TIGR02217 family)
MAFHAVRFPLDVALGARGGPERKTDVVTLASGREQRNGRWQHSRRRFNAGYGVKSRSDMAAVLPFSRSGAGGSMAFCGGTGWIIRAADPSRSRSTSRSGPGTARPGRFS